MGGYTILGYAVRGNSNSYDTLSGRTVTPKGGHTILVCAVRGDSAWLLGLDVIQCPAGRVIRGTRNPVTPVDYPK